MQCPTRPEEPGAAGATSATTNGVSSTPRLPAAPFRYQVPRPPHTQAHPLPPVHQHSPQSQPSPSTAVASPPLSTAPSTHGSHVNPTILSPQAAFSDKGRAQIACSPCRKNKVKCVNRGIHTLCVRCSGRKDEKCVYEDTPGGTKSRGNTDGNKDPRPLKRQRTVAPSTVGQQPHPHSFISIHEKDPLASENLTARLWEELFDIYEIHLASDFPFLHRTRFLSPLYQITTSKSAAAGSSSVPLPRPPHTPSLLLGFLALTSRFHEGLVKLFNWKPVEVAEWFANHIPDPTKQPKTLEGIQTSLFLGFHRWTDAKGQFGCELIDLAVRDAQYLNYQKDAKRRVKSEPGYNEKAASEDIFISREIERRTFWSCFILDRYSGCLHNRPPLIHVDSIATQLPCSDAAFLQGSNVKTRHLGEDDDKYAKRRHKENGQAQRDRVRGIWKNDHGDESDDWEVGKAESELSLYIRAVAHYGSVMTWSIDEGRRQEGDIPPWEKESKFWRLEAQHINNQNALPSGLVLTPWNTKRHACNKRSGNYVRIQAIYSVCIIVLYREYMAFMPWDEPEPRGPLDEPRIEKIPNEPDYWKNQARKCFRAAREFADLLETFRVAQTLDPNPLVGFAAFTVATCVIYCFYFPNMDLEGEFPRKEARTIVFRLLNIMDDMLERYAMAGQYNETILAWNAKFSHEKANWLSAGGADSKGTPGSTSSNGGLNVYIHEGYEMSHKQMGSRENRSFHGKADRDRLRLSSEDTDTATTTTSPVTGVKYEETPASTPASTAFTSINAQALPGPVRTKSDSQRPSSVHVPSRTFEATVHAAPISSPVTYEHQHDRSEYPGGMSPAVSTPARTMTASAVQQSISVLPMGQPLHPHYDQANSHESYHITAQAQSCPSPAQDRARLAQMKQAGAASWDPNVHNRMRQGHPSEVYNPNYFSTSYDGNPGLHDIDWRSLELNLNWHDDTFPSDDANDVFFDRRG